MSPSGVARCLRKIVAYVWPFCINSRERVVVASLVKAYAMHILEFGVTPRRACY